MNMDRSNSLILLEFFLLVETVTFCWYCLRGLGNFSCFGSFTTLHHNRIRRLHNANEVLNTGLIPQVPEYVVCLVTNPFHRDLNKFA